MRILVTGGSGFVGSALVSHLIARGHEVAILSRGSREKTEAEIDRHVKDAQRAVIRQRADADLKKAAAGNDNGDSSTERGDVKERLRAISWAAGKNTQQDQEKVDLRALRDFAPQGVVHLAGSSIAGRWTEAKKQEVWDSRVETTKLLGWALSHCSTPPNVAVCAAGISIYDRGFSAKDQRGPEAKIVTEDDAKTPDEPPGDCWLQDLSVAWEQSAQENLQFRGATRVVNARFGLIMDPSGGMLGQMLLPFKLGLGGVLGDGQHWMSWVSLHDVVRAIEYMLLEDQTISGGVSVVSPNPVMNYDFTKTLGAVLRRPTFFWMPETFLRTAGSLVTGRFIDDALLSSIRVFPAKLLEHGFKFDDEHLQLTLERMLR